MMRIADLFLLFLFVDADHVELTTTTSGVLNRMDFPSGFLFGAGTSAYQVEGAAAEDGRKPSTWDTYTHLESNIDKGTGDITSDQYHKYKDDVKLMHEMGLDAYRLSISWSRLIPDGHGAVNPKGLKYYNDLIDELVNHGIEAHVTLSHFDLPQALQDEYEGFLSPKFIDDFTAYADVCFKEFGDRVNSWMTFNEPNTKFGFTRCFSPFDLHCSNGDLQREAYLPAHNILLSHASAAHLYRSKYQEKQKGKIGITLLAMWYEPLTNSSGDINAADKELAFSLDWFMEPLVYGRYPAIMRKTCGLQLPNMTDKDTAQIKGSLDFIGLNHYVGFYVHGDDGKHHSNASAKSSRMLGTHDFASARNWRYRLKDFEGLKDVHFLAPGLGLEKLLEYVNLKYKNPAVVIHENGFPTFGDDPSDPAAQNDTRRILFIEAHIQSLLASIRNGSNVKGYFVWSFLDCFEVFGSYSLHYGLYGIDFSDKNRRRYPRQSVQWYSTFLAKTDRKQELHSSTYI